MAVMHHSSIVNRLHISSYAQPNFFIILVEDLYTFSPSTQHQTLLCSLSDALFQPSLMLSSMLQEETVWAVLAGMATAGQDLHTAEVAYAALNQTDKVHYINRIKVTTEARGLLSAASI